MVHSSSISAHAVDHILIGMMFIIMASFVLAGASCNSVRDGSDKLIEFTHVKVKYLKL